MTSYHGADTLLVLDKVVPLLTIDLSACACYPEYQNSRGDFLDAFFGHPIDRNRTRERLEEVSA